MSRDKEFPHIWILRAEKNDSKHYLIVNYEFNDDNITIRFGIDEITYRGIKKVIQDRCFEKTLLSEYTFRLLLTSAQWSKEMQKPFLFFFKKRNKVEYQRGSIEVSYRKEYKDVNFKCSYLFVCNIAWFRTIKSIDELKHLEVKVN